MYKDIAIISPSKLFLDRSKAILDENHYDFSLHVATGPNALSIAENLIKDGVKIIITRGNNVLIFRERFSIPILDVRYAYEDIFNIYEKAKKISDKIAIVAFGSALDCAKTYQKISGNKLYIPPIKDYNDVPSTIHSLAKEGYKVFLGGETTCKAASKESCIGIEINVGKDALFSSFKEAIHLHNIDEEKKRNSYFMEQVLQSTTSGIMAIDENKNILFSNKIVKRMLYDNINYFNREILSNNNILRMLESGSDIVNYIVTFNSITYSLDFHPIFVDKKFQGYVTIMQSSESVQITEQEIRKNLLSKEYVAKKTFSDIIGNSEAITKAIYYANRFAKSDATILITGETGNGKEIFAQSIHNASNRKNEPFVAVNCAAIPESILESELFGYTKGAFTGANVNGKKGLFELANRGTIFLDEIGEMPLNFQVKVLRVLQEHEITRVGDSRVIPIDIRVIAATNKDLIEQIEKGDFREDLYYRLSVLKLVLPPLRDRVTDIPLLVKNILSNNSRLIKITKKAMEDLCHFDYPGNVRQLQNVIERLIVMNERDYIDEDLINSVLGTEPGFEKNEKINSKQKIQSLVNDNITSKTIEDQEKSLVLKTLRENNHSKSVTAEKLGISKTTLWRWLKKYNIS